MREKYQLVTSSTHPTRDRTHNLGVALTGTRTGTPLLYGTTVTELSQPHLSGHNSAFLINSQERSVMLAHEPPFELQNTTFPPRGPQKDWPQLPKTPFH